MIFLSLLTLGNIVFLIYLAIRLLFIDKKSWVNRLLVVAMATVAMMSMIELEFLRITFQDELLYLSKIYQVLALTMMFVSTLSAYLFAKPFSKINNKYGLLVFGIMGVPFLTMLSYLLFTDFTFVTSHFKVNEIWCYQIGSETIFQKSYFYWYLGMGLILSLIFINAYKRENTKIKQSWLLVGSICLTIFPLGSIYIFLYLSQHYFAYYLVSFPMSICIGLMTWSFTNFKLFEINPISTFDKVMENMTSVVIIVDAEFVIQFANNVVLETFNLEKNEIIQLPLQQFTERLNLPDYNRLQEQCLALQENDFFQEDMIFNINGKDRYMQVNFSPVKNGWNDISGFLIMANDLTYHKETEAQLREQTKELEESNMELERFAYIASHDLKTPLRTVVSFLNLIERRIVKYKDAELSEFTSLARQGADQMFNLVQDVLEFSKLKNDAHKTEEVDLNQIIFDITRDLKETFVEKNADLQADYLPMVKGKSSQMKQVFQNLIENGLTYNKKEKPVIKVFYRRQNEQHLFGVSDNGIGIESQYNDKIFEMFKRLHNNTEFQGSGIGLAVCKKIINSQNGTIWVESEPGKGTTFFFTIRNN